MSVPEQIPTVSYTANGTTTNFPITFELSDERYLVVTKNMEIPPVGAYTVLNGNVIFGVAPNEGDIITLMRDTVLDRETNYQNYDNSFRPEAVNYDLDKIWHVLQEQNLIDAKLLARLKEEIEWRRTHDANFDELALMRDSQVFTGLKQYVDTYIAATNPNIFGGITAGIVFALDSKSVQTHLDILYQELVDARRYIDEEESRATNAETLLQQSITNETDRAIGVEFDLQTQINALGVGNKAYLTYAAMDADKINIPAKSKVTVTNDTTSSNNGDWQWDGATFTKSIYDPISQAKTYTDSKLPVIRALYKTLNNVPDKYVVLPSGNIASASGTILNIFPVVAGKTYVVKSNSISSASFAIALRATNSTADGTSLGLVTLNATTDPTIKTFTVAAGSTAKYAFVNIKIPSISFDITNDFLANAGLTIVEYDQIVSIDNASIVDEIGRAEALNKKDIILFNELYNPTNNVADNYVVLPSGSIGTSAGTRLSIFSVEAGKTYAVQSNSINNSAVAVALRATNSTATGSTLGLVTLVATSDPTVKKFTVSALGETLFALINIKIPGTGLDMSQDLSIKMSTLNETDEISGINDKELADRKARKQIISLENSIITANSNLSGKSWVAIGDSITEKNFRSNLNYHDYVSQEVGGMVIYNYGVSGSGFWNRANTIAGSITQTPDYITLFWGANDLIRAPKNLGTRDSTGTDSLGGLMNIALSALISKFYNKKFAVFTLLPRDIYNNVTNAIAVDESGVSQGYTATQVADLTIAVCEKYSIPVLDLYRESNLYPWITSANQYYFTAPGNTEPDGLHPNDNGQMLIAHKIREFMESL